MVFVGTFSNAACNNHRTKGRVSESRSIFGTQIVVYGPVTSMILKWEETLIL